MHGHESLTGLAIVALAALVCGMVMTRLKQPAVVGYILAGILLGPSALGFVENRDHVQLLAELGVLMLLFLVGMELSLRSFKAIWRVALLATLMQIGGGVLVMLAVSRVLGWSVELAILLGFVVALSSTAVTIKMLQDIGELRTQTGQITLGILIAQDLAVVPMMIVVGSMAGAGFGWAALAKVALSIGFLALLILYLSRRRRVALPFASVVRGSADLTPLVGLVFCFGAASITGLLGLSPAYGAFIGGLVLGNSTARPVMIRSTAPIQSVLLMIFFLSIGLLLDLGFLRDNLGEVLVLLLMVTVVKTVFNVGTLRLLGEPWARAFLAGVLLAQLGEFSFLLAAIGLGNGLIDSYNHSLIVAVTVLSLMISPFWLESARRLHRMTLLGITSSREILRLLYGDETRAFVQFSGRMGRGAVAAARAVGRRARRLRAERLDAQGQERVQDTAAEHSEGRSEPPAEEARDPRSDNGREAARA
ncbi:cation:proton antiporter [Rhodospirillaceae bacterium SYSU D60014]|uniref:cation:proton antiporter n=1 Tax=Virgifigura deserti TaxID=2268457 RepID=UPI000E66003D